MPPPTQCTYQHYRPINHTGLNALVIFGRVPPLVFFMRLCSGVKQGWSWGSGTSPVYNTVVCGSSLSTSNEPHIHVNMSKIEWNRTFAVCMYLTLYLLSIARTKPCMLCFVIKEPKSRRLTVHLTQLPFLCKILTLFSSFVAFHSADLLFNLYSHFLSKCADSSNDWVAFPRDVLLMETTVKHTCAMCGKKIGWQRQCCHQDFFAMGKGAGVWFIDVDCWGSIVDGEYIVVGRSIVAGWIYRCGGICSCLYRIFCSVILMLLGRVHCWGGRVHWCPLLGQIYCCWWRFIVAGKALLLLRVIYHYQFCTNDLKRSSTNKKNSKMLQKNV